MLRLQLLERGKQLLAVLGTKRGWLAFQDDGPVGESRRHSPGLVRCLVGLEAFELFDQRRSFEVQQLRRLTLVPSCSFERSLDERQLDAFDVPLEVDAV